MNPSRGFASDNNAGVHPDIFSAMQFVNSGHTIAYGDDPYTKAAIEAFKERLGRKIDVYFVFNGTAANVLGIKAITKSYHSVICSDLAHLHVDECGAPEKYTGCKLLTVPSSDGKLSLEGIQQHLHGFGFEHHTQPRVVSITQSTEMGTVYTPAQIRKIADLVHEYRLFLHMDGARIANAAASLNCSLREITVDAGVDLLSFGGTKNGMMFGEAIIFFNPQHSKDFKYIRKQGMQLGSKMRFVSAQFLALLKDDLWLRNSRHANKMAKYLEQKVRTIPQVKITQPVEANAVFAIIPKEYIPILQKEFFFYVWNENNSEVRWMTAFDTTLDDIDKFSNCLTKILQQKR
jgi:threonine aldolase